MRQLLFLTFAIYTIGLGSRLGDMLNREEDAHAKLTKYNHTADEKIYKQS